MRAEQWNGQGEFKGWIFRIATNLALNHLRMLRRRRQEPLETPPDEFDDEDERPSDPDWMIDNFIAWTRSDSGTSRTVPAALATC